MLQQADFAGVWQMRRVITDRRGPDGVMTGQAVIAGGRYVEDGVLRLGDVQMQARREYLWVFDEIGVNVRFSDGASFHDFVPQGRAEAMHLCGGDTYRACYDFTRWPAWQARWAVTGPRKDYVSVTDYCR